MTVPLTKAEKEKRKKERRDKKRKQQKQKSATVRTVTQPKPKSDANLCDDCVYEFGECKGTPKFASDFDPNLKGAAADRVVECGGYHSVEDVPPDQGQAAAPGPAAAEESEEPGPDEEGRELNEGQEEDQAPEEGELEPAPEPQVVIETEPIQRAPIDRFAKDTTDYGPCPTCTRPLKRTTYSRYVDAIRCTNPRCRAYRAIVKTVPSGAK